MKGGERGGSVIRGFKTAILTSLQHSWVHDQMKSLDRHIHHYYNSILIGHQSAGGETAFTVEPELLRSGLQRFPKLLSALLPPDADTSRFDINVYQLLRVSGEWAGWTVMDGQT